MLALIARVRKLLLSPAAEWDVIAAEPAEPRRLALSYVAPLAAIPAIATIVALAVLGVQAGGQLYRAPLLQVSLSAGLFFVLTIGAVFVFAAVIDWLAPRFGGERSYRQAFKVSAYSITAAMVAGLLAIAPALQIFALLGATYSLYLLFVGAPKVMRAPPKSAVNFSIVTTAAAVLVALVVGLAAMLVAAPTGNLFPGLPNLSIFTPETPRASVEAGTPAATAPTPLRPRVGQGGDLRQVAPQKLAGLDRVSVGYERLGVASDRTVTLEAEYRGGERRISLQIVFSPSIAKAIGFGGPATSEYNRETADGYSRRLRAEGAILVSDWDAASQTGSYGRLLQDQFYVRASGGGGVTPEDLRAAVEQFAEDTLALFAAEG